MRTLLIAAFMALPALIGCTEQPQELEAAQQAGYASDAWPEQLRERTLRQNESGRIY